MLFAFLISGIIILWAYIETFIIIRKVYKVTTDKINKTISILLISDLHFHNNSFLKLKVLKTRLYNLLRKEKFDYVFFTGDFIDNDGGLPFLSSFLSSFKRLDSYAVLGNHDYWNYNLLHFFYPLFAKFDKKEQNITSLENVIKENGILILKDQYIEKDDIIIYGIDYFSKETKIKFDFSSKKFKILLSHYPEVIENYKEADLLLSGHTHGGQITFFGLPIIVRSKLKRKWIRGISHHNETKLIVTKGLGESFYIPFRLFSLPEFVIIKIEPEGGKQ